MLRQITTTYKFVLLTPVYHVVTKKARRASRHPYNASRKESQSRKEVRRRSKREETTQRGAYVAFSTVPVPDDEV